MKIAAETLKMISLFQNLDIDDRQQIAKSMSIKKFGTKQVVISQDDDSSDVFFVVNGNVRCYVFPSYRPNPLTDPTVHQD